MSSIHSRKWRKLREEVFREYGRACAYCGYEDEVMTVDHIIPRSKNGLDILENLLPACRKCNYSKSNKVQLHHLMERTPFLKALSPNSLDLKQKDEV
jgi:5-methylcytosine-specific restriction endonuclease McrA